MDSGDADPACRDGYKVSAVDGSEQEGVDKGDDDGDGDGKRLSLHPSAVNCVMPGERPKSLGRKVTWNDVNGNKLVEVLEFYPSDTSDSEDEQDDCVCTIIWIIRLLLSGGEQSSHK
ncbi:ssDNA-binding transcriptional regulator domain-containing protein [Dioscorea alata]|uniref:SsDNA-binding transcriptional regulator domain-containing protein n=1 Tax=Dioscorea alata TaxID=55571 RepID=A0ACB7V8K8_DIOAL|nr:ssDNA-binding transcriptional regulator domain-containing protein [Dioscorea alata]